MLFTRLLSAAALCATTLASDGFVSMDFVVLKGPSFLKAISNFVDDSVDEVADKIHLVVGDLANVAKATGDFSVVRRSNEVSISNQRVFYTAEIALGSEDSKVKVLIDTGSADLWVTGSQNPQCSSNGGSIDCSRYGTFNANASSTWKDNHTDFSIQYLDGSYAKGTFGQDSLTLSDTLKLDNANFAVAEDTDSDVAVFGIGFKDLESTRKIYDNIPLGLKNAGLIKKNAYSLYLTSQEASTGSLLFGGVDHAKYEGDLKTLDIQQEQGYYAHFNINLESISIDLTAKKTKREVDNVCARNIKVQGSALLGASTLATKTTISSSWPTAVNASGHSTSLGSPVYSIAPSVSTASISSSTSSVSAYTPASSIAANYTVVLDSGTTLTLLPSDTVDKILQILDPNFQTDDDGSIYVNCSLANPLNTLTYTFVGKDIVVKMTDLVISAGTDINTGKPVCRFGIVPGDYAILGDNFLRSCYSVFNLDDKTVSIAQVKYTDDTEIQAIE